MVERWWFTRIFHASDRSCCSISEPNTRRGPITPNAYLLAGITEFWRAYRQYAAVLHFVYLTSSDPLGYTSDHFRDVEKLDLDPYFRDYMSQAFAPLGVYLSFG
jgi:hypothetical protein